MSRQHELRRDLHFAVRLVLEGREVRLVFVGVDLLPVSVVSCRGTTDMNEELSQTSKEAHDRTLFYQFHCFSRQVSAPKMSLRSLNEQFKTTHLASDDCLASS